MIETMRCLVVILIFFPYELTIESFMCFGTCLGWLVACVILGHACFVKKFRIFIFLSLQVKMQSLFLK